MELKHLKVFVIAAEQLNFSRTAELAFISQSTVTKYIQCLEDELGEKLFLRSGRRTILSERGKVFLPYALAIIKNEEEALYALHSLKEKQLDKVIRVGLSSTLTISPSELFFIPFTEALRDFSAKYPAYKVECSFYQPSDMMVLLENNQMDIAIQPLSGGAGEFPSSPGITYHCIDEGSFLLVVKEDGEPVSQDSVGLYLGSMRNFRVDDTALAQKASLLAAGRYGLSCQIQVCQSWQKVYLDILTDDGLSGTIIPSNMKKTVNSCGLKTVPIQNFPGFTGLYAIYKTDAFHGILPAFLEELEAFLPAASNCAAST